MDQPEKVDNDGKEWWDTMFSFFDPVQKVIGDLIDQTGLEADLEQKKLIATAIIVVVLTTVLLLLISLFRCIACRKTKSAVEKEEEASDDGNELLKVMPRLKRMASFEWKEEGSGTNFKLLCELLKGNAIPLKQLNCKNNKIGTEGARMISEVLKSNSTLTELDLSYNEIGDEGARMISEGLESNSTLTKLYLGNNNIGAEGAKMVSERWNSNRTLKSLYLGGEGGFIKRM